MYLPRAMQSVSAPFRIDAPSSTTILTSTLVVLLTSYPAVGEDAAGAAEHGDYHHPPDTHRTAGVHAPRCVRRPQEPLRGPRTPLRRLEHDGGSFDFLSLFELLSIQWTDVD